MSVLISVTNVHPLSHSYEAMISQSNRYENVCSTLATISEARTAKNEKADLTFVFCLEDPLERGSLTGAIANPRNATPYPVDQLRHT